MLELRRCFRRRFRFRQVDLYFRLVLFEGGRDHEKDKKDGEDTDERNNNDRGREPLPNREIHHILTSSLTRVCALSAAPSWVRAARPARYNLSRCAPPA